MPPTLARHTYADVLQSPGSHNKTVSVSGAPLGRKCEFLKAMVIDQQISVPCTLKIRRRSTRQIVYALKCDLESTVSEINPCSSLWLFISRTRISMITRSSDPATTETHSCRSSGARIKILRKLCARCRRKLLEKQSGEYDTLSATSLFDHTRGFENT